MWLLLFYFSSSRCRGLVCDLRFWYFLVILTYFVTLLHDNAPAHTSSIAHMFRSTRACLFKPSLFTDLDPYYLYIFPRQKKNIEGCIYHNRDATRGIWKVLSMVFYLSNRFTNPIMFDIILKNYFSCMLWHKFQEDIIM